jgi:hypothetical protein
VKLEPVNDWVIGRALIPKPSSKLALDPARGVTRCFLLDEVGSGADAAGYKPGDIVVAQKVFDMTFKKHCITFPIGEVICRIRDVSLEDFVDLKGEPLPEVAQTAVS